MSLKLHVISFDVPYPADYGGVIDVFHKLRLLKMAGIDIYLHCFDYGRGHQVELEKYCARVSYYKRKTGLASFFSSKPYIVKSRISEELKNNLLKDEVPILCEGIHTTGFLTDTRFANRTVAIRPTNVEHDYYKLLAEREKNFLRKYFFISEALKLKMFDRIHLRAKMIFPISESDNQYFKSHFSKISSYCIFPFNALDKLENMAGKGDYALFHGNLSVAENEEVARFIIRKISPRTDFKINIAGKNPSKSLVELARNFSVELIPNPADDVMEKLVSEAHIQLMITFQPTGFKNKLLLSVFKGRFIIANNAILTGSSLDNLVEIANNADEIVSKIEQLRNQEFTQKMIDVRNEHLNNKHFNQEKAKMLISKLFA